MTRIGKLEVRKNTLKQNKKDMGALVKKIGEEVVIFNNGDKGSSNVPKCMFDKEEDEEEINGEIER